MMAVCGRQPAECESCGKDEYDALTVHHDDPEGGHGHACGGSQHLYLLEQDLVDGISLTVLCVACHNALHSDKDVIA